MRPTLVYASLLTAFVVTGCGGGDGATGTDRVRQGDMPATTATTVAQPVQAVQPIVFGGVIANYTVAKTGAGYLITDTTGAEAPRTVAATARLRFADMSMAFDADGNPGQAYRLYRAAFAREPDPAGLGYWIGVLDQGAYLYDVAGGFTASAEFKNLYAKATTNRDIVGQYYVNVLNRQGESAGIDYWTGVLDSKADNLGGVLRNFSEGPENKASTAATIANGIRYVEYGVRYPATAYPVRAAYLQSMSAPHTDFLTVSGTCSGNAMSTHYAPVAATFEGQAVKARQNVVDAYLLNCPVTKLYRWDLTDYYDDTTNTLLGHVQAEEYDVGSGTLPATAKIGDKGTFATQTVYTDSTKQTYAGKRVLNYAVEADDSAVNSAIVTVTSVRTNAANEAVVTVSNRFRVATDGTMQPLSAEQQYSNGTRLLFTQNPANAQPAKLTVTDTVTGTGAVAQNGKTLTVNYTGWLYDPNAANFKGQQFDSSVGRAPFSFTLGIGQVIAGWEQGMLGMRVGGKRTLLIPSNLGYGVAGAPGSIIKGNAALVFEVELVGVK